MSMHITKEPYGSPAIGVWVIGLRKSKSCVPRAGSEGR